MNAIKDRNFCLVLLGKFQMYPYEFGCGKICVKVRENMINCLGTWEHDGLVVESWASHVMQ